MRAEWIASAARPDQFPPESLPEIAFLGRSNVGKSSLLNCLVGAKGLAFTSSKPGCTQLINFYRVEGGFHFVDLPGYGYARVPTEISRAWKELAEAYLAGRNVLCLSLLIVDARRGWMDADLDLRNWLEFHQRQFKVVATKFDKLNQKEQYRGLAALREHSPDEPLPFSAVSGRGAREIWQAISKINKPVS